MKLRLIFGMSCMLVFSTSLLTAQQPDSLSLESMIALVLRNNPAAHESERGIAASRSAAEAASSAYYPDARVDLSYVRLGPVAEISFPGAGSFRLYPADNYNGNVSIHQQVYDFNKTAQSVNLASARTAIAEDRLEEVKSNLSYVTVQLFYTVLFDREELRVQDDHINTLNQYLAFTGKKVQAGTATEFDLLTTRVRIAAAQNQKVDLMNRIRKEEIALRRLADLPTDFPINLRGTFSSEGASMDADSLFAAGKGQRIDVKEAQDAIASAAMQAEVATAANNPSVTVDLAYGFKNGYIPNLDVLRGNFVAGVSLHVPLFDGFKTRNLGQEAQARLLAARDHLHGVETQLRADIMDAISDLQASMDKLQTSKLNVEQAQTAVDLARVKYDAGVITNLDLLDAQTALEQARLTDLQSLYGFVLSRYGLKRAAGERIW